MRGIGSRCGLVAEGGGVLARLLVRNGGFFGAQKSYKISVHKYSIWPRVLLPFCPGAGCRAPRGNRRTRCPQPVCQWFSASHAFQGGYSGDRPVAEGRAAFAPQDCPAARRQPWYDQCDRPRPPRAAWQRACGRKAVGESYALSGLWVPCVSAVFDLQREKVPRSAAKEERVRGTARRSGRRLCIAPDKLP